MDRDPNLYDRDSTVPGHNTSLHTNTSDMSTSGSHVYDHDSRRGSNTLAYLIGGLVLALGLLAFLFYDGNNGDVSTTGSTSTQTERPATPAPAPGAGPAAPTTPSRPATQP